MFNEYLPLTYKLSDLEEINKSLVEEGFAVIEIPSIDLDKLKELFAQDMSSILGHDISFPELWDNSIETPIPEYFGLYGEYGLSQGDATWHVRTNKDIINLYKNLLKVNKVVCSMDAIGFSQDNVRGDSRTWLHVDQNPSLLGGDFNSIQGIFYAEDSFGDRAGTVVVPSSHKDWLQHTYENSHFTIVDQEKYAPKAVKLNIKAGCLLLFSSKLVHQGTHDPHRLCFMVSYGDANLRTEDVRKTKIVMYLSGQRSNHQSQFSVYHGWKWQYGEKWNMLIPKTTIDTEYQIDMVEDEVTEPSCYFKEMDLIIPQERLDLL